MNGINEIERKWRLKELPADIIAGIEPKFIEQSYASINPELRLSKMTDINGNVIYHRLTYKSDGDINRIEITTDISEKTYLEFMDNVITASGVVLHKEYYKCPFIYNNKEHHYEMSIVDKKWCYLEIEFDSEEEANSFVAPEWFGVEVTNDKRFKMKSYAYNIALTSHLEEAFAKMYMKDNLPMLLTEEELNAPDMVPEEMINVTDTDSMIIKDKLSINECATDK